MYKTGLAISEISKYLGLCFWCYTIILPRQTNMIEQYIGYALIGLFILGIIVSFKDYHIWYTEHYREHREHYKL